MEVRGQQKIAADIDHVFKTFGSPDFINTKQLSLGSRNIDIKRCDLADNRLELDFQREVPVDAPALLKKFLGDWNLVRQVESWTGTPGQEYRCTTRIEIKGAPVTITGNMALHKDGAGCINEVSLSIECKIPLVGGKLAGFVGDTTEKSMVQEFKYLVDYMAQQG